MVGGVEAPLTALEFRLLATFVSAKDRVLSREQLLRDVWGYRTRSRTRTLDAHASRLRRKLRAADPSAELVENKWGVGYRLLGTLST